MTSKDFSPRFLIIVTAILGAALLRLVPHWPNFTPVAAVALFGGAYLSRKYLAFLIPLAAMFISDIFLGFHPYLLPVYGCFAVTVVLGRVIRKNIGLFSVLGASLLSSVIFFLVTNFAMWWGNPNFSQDFQGLVQCYTLGIPFFNNGILGDLFYNGILFGGLSLAGKYIPALQKA